MRYLHLALALSSAAFSAPVCAQVSGQAPSDRAARGGDPLVLERLEDWRDAKVGLLLHWGTYSQWGIVESWTLCSEDEPWCARHLEDYGEYTRRYEALQETFNPVRFDPGAWADAAHAAGLRYVVFTTKHHDGFCMWDTAQTDYKVTDPACAYSLQPRPDVTARLFEAFRARGFLIGAYFSKPDWHSNDYWWRRFATPDRNVNYSLERYAERWQRFKGFVYAQLEELMSRYGRVDLLWLDGGWVRPKATITPDVAVWCKSPEDQDIDMPRIAAMARRHQPGLIIVDRTVHGPYEDYVTPEQHVPDEPLLEPWESCVTMAQQWSYKPDDVYKPTRELVRLVVDVVAKGGNLLLGVGPDPLGELPPEALSRLAELGEWMAVNGVAIHASRPIAPYKSGAVAFTRAKDGRVHAIVLAGEGEDAPPETVRWRGPRPMTGRALGMLGVEGELAWSLEGDEVVVTIPASVRAAPPCRYAWTLTFDAAP
ncbi:MAG: alpha-L-fucosidase [Planctomycetota bacterium]